MVKFLSQYYYNLRFIYQTFFTNILNKNVYNKRTFIWFQMFPIVGQFEILMKSAMKFELRWGNQMKIIVTLWSFCLGCRMMFRMFGMWDVECSGYGMFGVWDVWDVECVMWDIFWDVGYWFGKMPSFLGSISWFTVSKPFCRSRDTPQAKLP